MDGGRSQSGVMRKVRQLNVPAKLGPGERIDNISFTLLPVRESIRADDGLSHTSQAYCFQQPVNTLKLVTVGSRW